MNVTYTEYKEIISGYVEAAKIASQSFTETISSTSGLIDKIGLIVTYDTVYNDKLSFLDKQFLEYGKTIEEWSADLIRPEDRDENGSTTLAPRTLGFKNPTYSYTLDEKTFPVTIRRNDFNAAVHNAAQYGTLIAIHTKRMQDSKAVWKYAIKRELLGKLAHLCDEEMTEDTVFATSTAYSLGTVLKESAGSNARGVVVRAIKSSDSSNWATHVTKGDIVVLDLIKEIAKPVDTATGEAFLKQIKDDIEIAKDENEGHSLNGNSLGATEGLKLIVSQGIMSTLDIDVLAGAFNLDKMKIEVEVIVTKDFGKESTGVFAMLIDSRGVGVFPNADYTMENVNAQGGFINYFNHYQVTCAASRNTFVRVYRAA